MSAELQHVEANGVRFAYFEEGEGPLVLLIHGFPDTAHTWDDLRPRLAAKGYRAVAYFQRGYHPSAIPMRDPDQETISRDALALIGALGEKKAIVVGHDWGATAAYGAAAIGGPKKVEKLFTVAIPHPLAIKPTVSKVWGVRHVVTYKLPGAAKRFAKDDFAVLRELYARWNPSWTDVPESELAPVKRAFSNRASLEAALGYYRTLSPTPPPYLKKKIEVPTVAVAGTDDPIAELSDYERAERWFTAGYTVETMPGGHFLHREHPEIFAEKILAHL
ncbi:MAG: alpha/beta hydrolase [Sandaracinaceae bacterium]